MDHSEILAILDLGDLPIVLHSVSQIDTDYNAINNYVPLIVNKVNESYDRGNVIELKFNGITEGYLVFIKYKQKIAFSNMTEFEFIAFLSEGNFEDYALENYEFENDYILIKDTFWNKYQHDYFETSVLWGGFSHKLNFTEPSSKYVNNVLEIEAGDKLGILDNHAYESAIRAIEQPYAFERFLKMYHLLELQFDFYIIDKIKNLVLPNDANVIGKLLKNYSKNSNELDKLTQIISNHCVDISALEDKLALVLPYKVLAKEIFVKYGNDSRPLGRIDKFNKVFDSTSFSKANLVGLNVTKETNHDEFIIKLVSYWIYRIRCSVAHNKIGEYLLSWNDEGFIVEFAEPLLNEVLKQCFKE